MNDVALNLKWELEPNKGSLVSQLAEHARLAIRRGDFRPGDRLPATRRLAADLGVSRGTVTSAIELLVAEGILEPRIGSGVYVSPDAGLINDCAASLASDFIAMPREQPPPRVDSNQRCRVDFRICSPSLETFPLAEWRRCLSAASTARPSSHYPDPAGDPQLREAIAQYLRRSRALNAEIDEIVVTNGGLHAGHVIAALFVEPGDKVAVEDPGFLLARDMFRRSGAELIGIGVDEKGIRTDDLPEDADRIKMIHVTPSHQFPLGSRLSLARRRTLIDWAQRHEVIVIEDDYGVEYRYDAPPLAPLASMTNNCVVYCGTFSKTMFPGLRIGFAVAPKPLIAAMTRYRVVTEYAPNSLIQAALARFVRDGHFERHVHRMRRKYSAKRAVLAESIAQSTMDAELAGMESGLHAILQLNSGTGASELAQRARQDGVLARPIGHYMMNNDADDNALVIGYAAPSNERIREGIAILDRHWSTA